MVAINAIRASNAQLKASLPNPVAVFVGATGGIGESTVKQLAANSVQPTLYIVGRNKTAGARIVEELKSINAAGLYNFISADVSLLRNVDKVCDEIKANEQRLGLLFLSQGYITFGAREGEYTY